MLLLSSVCLLFVLWRFGARARPEGITYVRLPSVLCPSCTADTPTSRRRQGRSQLYAGQCVLRCVRWRAQPRRGRRRWRWLAIGVLACLFTPTVACSLLFMVIASVA